jgi:Anti-sigma-K factor rskA
MASSDELRELVRKLREVAAMVALSPEIEEVPAGLRNAVMHQALAATNDATTTHYQWLSWLPWAVAASLALGSILLLQWTHSSKVAKELNGRIATLTAERDRATAMAAESREQMQAVLSQVAKLTGEREALTRKITQLEERNDASRVETAKLTADRNALQARVSALERNANVLVATLTSKLSGAPQALATIVWDGAKQQGLLQTADVPPTAADQDYQLWIADPKYKDPVDGGIFSVGKSGKAEVIFRPKLRITSASAFLVSLERKGGVSKAEGPIVLAGKLIE